MKRAIKSFLIFSIFILTFVSCYYDSEEALYPELSTSFDTTNVTFSGTIVTILSNNCWSCHSNQMAASQGNNIHLEDYNDVVTYSLNIIGAINHNPGFPPMPKNGGKLKSCSITQFEIWVSNGTPAN